jgi:hypothetical protein
MFVYAFSVFTCSLGACALVRNEVAYSHTLRQSRRDPTS